ncbi:MAG: fibronectin type III domain-containing protein [Patescibacteria group bacterium]
MNIWRNALLAIALSTPAWLALPAHALTINSLDCSNIDTTDGNTADWDNIPFLVDSEASITGTTYYLDGDSGEWTTTEPTTYQYSTNIDQWADIKKMKICNTADDFFMMMEGAFPMMAIYDHENDQYVSIYSVGENFEALFTQPVDFDYWMTWKFRDTGETGSIIYFAAHINLPEGELDMSGGVDNPQLFLYEDSDTAATFETATFDPNQDTELTTIEISENQGEQGECDEDCGQVENVAFEVRQNITKFFEYADFSYGDTVNVSMAMYNNDLFEEANGNSHLTAVDETEGGEYTISKNGVRKLKRVAGSLSAKTVRLTWKDYPKAASYQIKLINPKNDEVIRTIKDVMDNKKTIKGLQADHAYRATVRAVIKGKTGAAKFSAWSSSYKWTTDAE